MVDYSPMPWYLLRMEMMCVSGDMKANIRDMQLRDFAPLPLLLESAFNAGSVLQVCCELDQDLEWYSSIFVAEDNDAMIGDIRARFLQVKPHTPCDMMLIWGSARPDLGDDFGHGETTDGAASPDHLQMQRGHAMRAWSAATPCAVPAATARRIRWELLARRGGEGVQRGEECDIAIEAASGDFVLAQEQYEGDFAGSVGVDGGAREAGHPEDGQAPPPPVPEGERRGRQDGNRDADTITVGVNGGCLVYYEKNKSMHAYRDNEMHGGKGTCRKVRTATASGRASRGWQGSSAGFLAGLTASNISILPTRAMQTGWPLEPWSNKRKAVQRCLPPNAQSETAREAS